MIKTDRQLIAECIQWALDHGYNPFNSTVNTEQRAARMWQAFDEIITKKG
jgi:hypothetical protein